MLILSIFLSIVSTKCVNYSSISINSTVQSHQISQYLDTVRGCLGLSCFVINFTDLTVSYSVAPMTVSLVGCNFTNYVMVQKKVAKLWHFQICNMSLNQVTAGSVTLKYQNLITGNKFESPYATFGQFSNDADFPWFYSKAASQMVQPWYFMRTFLKLSFNVNSQKMVMTGNIKNRGYQKSKNKIDTTVYRLEGYPDDTVNRSILTTDMAINISQMVLAANGHYIVYLTDSGPSLSVYNTTQQKVIYQQAISATNDPSLCKLSKINQTHVGVAVGGLNAWVGIWDLRIPALIVDFCIINSNSNITLSNNTIVTMFTYNLALILHSSTSGNIFHIFTDIPVKMQPNYQYVTEYVAQDPLVCQSPGQIIGTSCIICNYQCLLCDSNNPNKCITCSYGFQLQAETQRCVPNTALKWIVNAIAISGMLNIGGYFWIGGQYLDMFFMLAYQNLRFDSHGKSALKLAHFANMHKCFPYSLQIYIQSTHLLIPNSSITQSQSRSLMLPKQYTRVLNLQAYPTQFSNLIQYIAIWGIIMQVILLFIIKIVFCKLMTLFGFRKCINKSQIIMILIIILQSRISFVTFNFFNQIQVPSYMQPISKLYIIALVLAFFVILVYSTCGHQIARYFCSNRSAQLIYNSHYKPNSSSLLFISICSILNLLISFAYSYLNQSALTQKITLIIISLCMLGNTMKHFQIFQTTTHLCTDLFMRATVILFYIVLLLDQLNCPQFFQVSIKIIQLIIMIMISILTVSQIIACLGITILRIIRTLITTLSSHIQQRTINFEVLNQIAQIVDQNGQLISKKDQQADIQIQIPKISNIKNQENKVEVDAQSVDLQQDQNINVQKGSKQSQILEKQKSNESNKDVKSQEKQNQLKVFQQSENINKLAELNSSQVSLFQSFLSLLKSTNSSQGSTNTSFQSWIKSNKVSPSNDDKSS